MTFSLAALSRPRLRSEATLDLASLYGMLRDLDFPSADQIGPAGLIENILAGGMWYQIAQATIRLTGIRWSELRPRIEALAPALRSREDWRTVIAPLAERYDHRPGWMYRFVATLLTDYPSMFSDEAIPTVDDHSLPEICTLFDQYRRDTDTSTARDYMVEVCFAQRLPRYQPGLATDRYDVVVS
jgi:hypothetical protein